MRFLVDLLDSYSEQLADAFVVVTETHVRIGRVEKQATGVEISMSRDITVRHCSIYEVPRAGINIGDGCWGGNVIEFCDVIVPLQGLQS